LEAEHKTVRDAKRKALDIIVGSHSDDDELGELEGSDSEGSIIDEYKQQDEETAADSLPDDDSIDGEAVYWNTSDEESEEDDNIPDLAPFHHPVEVAPDGTTWTKGLRLNAAGRQPRQNIFHGVPGAIKRGIHPACKKEAFLVFSDNILEKSVMYTNLHGRRSTELNNRKNHGSKTWRKTDNAPLVGR
jgi:hypothetical protein